MRGDKIAIRSSFGKTIRKRLSDITNYQPQPKSPLVFEPQNVLSSYATNDQIDRLLKENAGLMKLIADKNKVIEMNGVELQKLRVVVQKMQLQNWNLAQSNSHMMAELNLGKQKLKTLQHQLTCKDALLKTTKLELQAQVEINDRKEGSQMKDGDTADIKPQNGNSRRHTTRSQSTGPLMTTVQQVPEQETVQNKRRCVRRQSARFRSQEHESKEDLFEIKDLKMHEDGGRSSKMIEQKICSSKPKPQESQRMSFGRPLRRAAEKIQSYKETPINVKMRRPE